MKIIASQGKQSCLALLILCFVLEGKLSAFWIAPKISILG